MTDASTASLVLDTNVVLDWLVFRDARAGPLDTAIRSGRWRWQATPSMREELEHVLTYEDIAAWKPDRQALSAAWDRWAVIVEPCSPSLAVPLRCTDPDDQKFIDLALSLPGATLLSRDRAVLKLARRARAHGLLILPPERWAP